MKQANMSDGFTLILALLMIALAMLMTSIMFDQGSSYMPYAHAALMRQKATALATAGLAVAQNMLCSLPSEQEQKPGTTVKKEQAKKRTDEEDTQHLLRTIMPHLNRWQTITLQEDRDGVDGTLHICLMSEDGKLNINKIYDFKNKKFKNEADAGGGFKAAVAALCADIEKNMHGKELFSALEQFLQKRGYPLNDVTELLTIKQFAIFKNNIYHMPLFAPKSDTKEQRPSFALTDIFTTFSTDAAADPWVFSESLRTALHLPATAGKTADEKQVQTIAEVTQKYAPDVQWSQAWNTSLKMLYDVEFSHLPKHSATLMRGKSALRYFSVLIQTVVGDVTQQFYVILERIKKSQDTKTVYDVVVRSFYWL
jgi:hypothetical protein